MAWQQFIQIITQMHSSYLAATMIFREATIQDILQIQTVRNSVKENQLSNAALISDKDCEDYIRIRDKGWMYQIDGCVVGFSIADIQANNIWLCLFISNTKLVLDDNG
jgi:hypothetical protein